MKEKKGRGGERSRRHQRSGGESREEKRKYGRGGERRRAKERGEIFLKTYP